MKPKLTVLEEARIIKIIEYCHYKGIDIDKVTPVIVEQAIFHWRGQYILHREKNGH